MTFIHQGSFPVISEENQLFSLPNTLSESYETHDVELGPTTSTHDSNYIEFDIPASESEYIMLCHTRLRCIVSLTKEQTAGSGKFVPLDGTDQFSVCNNLISSLWRSVEVSIEDKTVTSPTTMYGYRALLENLLGCSARNMEAILQNGLFVKDLSEDFDSFTTNNGLIIRRDQLKKPLELSGPLHISLFQQSRPLISGVKMRVRLIPQITNFYLQAGSDIVTKFTISNPRLIVRKMVPSASYKLAVEKLLVSQSAKYPIERVQMRSFTIASGSSSMTLENVVNGQLPKHVLLCMVNQSAFSGNSKRNPYYFNHYDLNYLTLEVDGRQIPTKALTPNFTEGKYLDAYEQLLDSLGRLHVPDAYMSFTRHEYTLGNAIFGFDLSPTKAGLGCMSLVKRGTMRIQLGWATPLPTSITVILRLTYDNVVEITRDRLVNFDFIL